MTHTTTSKNGFEIRLEIMQLAHAHLDAAYRAKVEVANAIVGSIEREEALRALRYPTANEVINVANSLYDFVSRSR